MSILQAKSHSKTFQDQLFYNIKVEVEVEIET